MSSDKDNIMNKLMSLYDDDDNNTEITPGGSVVDTTTPENKEEFTDDEINYFQEMINKNDDEDIDLTPSIPQDEDSSKDDYLLSELKIIREYKEELPEDSDEDIDQIISDQYFNSKQARLYTPPSGAVIISESPEDPEKYVTPTNNDILVKAVMIVSSIIMCVIIFIAVGFFMMKDNQIQNNAQDVKTMEQALSEVSHNDKDSTQSTRGVALGNISSVKSTVEYEILASPSINLASVSYIENSGEEKIENFSTFPWKKTVNLASNIIPQLGVSTSGEGEIMCVITKDGKEMVSKKSSGKSPTLIC